MSLDRDIPEQVQVKPAASPEAIDVAVVAPALALRAGLHALLSGMEGIEVVAEAAALAELDPFPPGVDLLILAGGEGGGEEAELVMNTDEVAILWLAADVQQSARLFPESLSHARGILPLEATAEELHAAIRALAEGLWVGAPALVGALFGGPSKQVDPDAEPLIEPLTEREVEVLGWLAQGLANKQIAVQLGISEHTVKFHVSAIYAKLGATSRTEAVRQGVHRGLVVL
jgi:DNA-binding NarL/FixJ family response regulator